MLSDAMRLVDLFCGTGGFARGAERVGLSVSLAVDIDANLTFSHKRNFPKTKLLREDLSPMTGARLKDEAGGEIDGIFGGPPCQGFSSMGRRDPSDERRLLLKHFFRLVAEAEPTFFIMENVKGLLEKGGRGELDEAMSIVERYDLLEPQVLNAADFGAATKRNRIFVVGVHKDKGDPVSAQAIARQRRPPATVEDAIRDLTGATYDADDELGFDRWNVGRVEATSAYAAGLRSRGGITTGHRITAHTDAVRERFSAVRPGDIDLVGRHHRLQWDSQCPTLRAGTGADKGSYQSVRPIHPSEHRVITVREAARLQGFPDRHYFHPTVWHSFRMIGNSVAPLVAEVIFRAVLDALGRTSMDEPKLQAAE